MKTEIKLVVKNGVGFEGAVERLRTQVNSNQILYGSEMTVGESVINLTLPTGMSSDSQSLLYIINACGLAVFHPSVGQSMGRLTVVLC